MNTSGGLPPRAAARNFGFEPAAVSFGSKVTFTPIPFLSANCCPNILSGLSAPRGCQKSIVTLPAGWGAAWAAGVAVTGTVVGAAAVAAVAVGWTDAAAVVEVGAVAGAAGAVVGAAAGAAVGLAGAPPHAARAAAVRAVPPKARNRRRVTRGLGTTLDSSVTFYTPFRFAWSPRGLANITVR